MRLNLENRGYILIITSPLCWSPVYQDEQPFDVSTMVSFRKRFDVDIVMDLNICPTTRIMNVDISSSSSQTINFCIW